MNPNAYVGFFTLLMILVIPASQASDEDASQQTSETSSDFVCKDGLELVWEHDGTPICVEPESVLKLVESGGLPSGTIDKISISDRRAHEISENTYAFQFNYCADVYNQGALGVIVSSDTEKIPVQIDPNIQIHQCHQYGAQIHASSDSSLKTSLFYEKDIQTLFKTFEKKKMDLQDDLIHYQQKLLRLQDSNLDEDNLEEIIQMEIRIDLISQIIQSYKEGLNTLRALQ